MDYGVCSIQQNLLPFSFNIMFVMCLFLFAHIIETFKLLMPLSNPNITQQVYMYFVCSIQQHSVCFPSAAFNTITTLEELLMPALSPNFLSDAGFEFCDLLTVLTVHRQVKVKRVYRLGYSVHRSTFRTLSLSLLGHVHLQQTKSLQLSLSHTYITSVIKLDNYVFYYEQKKQEPIM